MYRNIFMGRLNHIQSRAKQQQHRIPLFLNRVQYLADGAAGGAQSDHPAAQHAALFNLAL